jgi:hypothetical protein
MPILIGIADIFCLPELIIVLMPIVRNFVNHASSQGLKSYFSANDGFDLVDWSKEQPEVARKVIQLYDISDKRQTLGIQLQKVQDSELI